MVNTFLILGTERLIVWYVTWNTLSGNLGNHHYDEASSILLLNVLLYNCLLKYEWIQLMHIEDSHLKQMFDNGYNIYIDCFSFN